MNRPILNRNFEHPTDGWYHIEPKGNHPNKGAKVVQVIDDAACQSIVNRFNQDAEAGTLSHGHEMLIDREHFKHDASQATTAYGWLQKLENRADGYYGQIRWSGTGQAAVDGGDYRFFSTEYDPKDLKVLNTKNGIKSVRPLKLDGLTLTNDPNNLGGRPITNRAMPEDGCCPDCGGKLNPTGKNPGDMRCVPCKKDFAPAAAEAANQKPNQTKPMKNVALKLGLAEEASESSILDAVIRIMNRVTTLEGEVTPLRNRSNELETENQMLLGEQVDGILAERQVTDAKIINRLKPSLITLKNRADRLAYLDDLNIKAPAAGKSLRILNRGAGAGKAEESAAGGDDEQAKAEKSAIVPMSSKKGGLSFDASWAKAVAELSA